MIYKDHKGVSIDGIWNKSVKFTATRHCVAYGDSMDDVQQWLRDTPGKWTTTQSRNNGATETWDRGLGYEGALRMANEGWPEGVEMIDKALQAIVPSTGREARWGWAQQGGSVSIGRYLTGHPKSMRNRRKKQMGAAPVLHLIVNCVASCGITAKQFTNYGASIAGLVDRLENMGRRVHLDMVMVVQANDNSRLSYGWNVKRASEPMDLSRVAFALAHPAAFRRIGFAMSERMPAETQDWGYGHCADALPCDVPDYNDGTMIVDGVNHEPNRCNTPKDALRLAIEQLNKAAVLAGHATPDMPLINEDEWLRDLAD